MDAHYIDLLEATFQKAVSEIVALRSRIAELEKDASRLDSGMIMTHERDDLGDEYQCLRTGIDLRAAIDAATNYEDRKADNGNS